MDDDKFHAESVALKNKQVSGDAFDAFFSGRSAQMPFEMHHPAPNAPSLGDVRHLAPNIVRQIEKILAKNGDVSKVLPDKAEYFLVHRVFMDRPRSGTFFEFSKYFKSHENIILNNRQKRTHDIWTTELLNMKHSTSMLTERQSDIIRLIEFHQNWMAQVGPRFKKVEECSNWLNKLLMQDLPAFKFPEPKKPANIPVTEEEVIEPEIEHRPAIVASLEATERSAEVQV